MPVQVSKVTHNNKGRFYRIAIDIAKEGAEVWDLTPYFKGRVGDDNFGLQIVWYYQGRLMDVTNKTPYIKGNVGHYSFDEQKNLQMAPDADVVTSHGKPSDCQANGQATYYFPQQMFPTDGIFKGFIGLEDENQNLTGVDIWFRVLPGVAKMGHACDVYVDVLDKTIADFKEKIRQQSIDFDAALQLELQKEKELIQQKLDAASDAMDEDTTALKKLAAAVGAIQAQIDAGDVVTLVKHNADYKELSNKQDMLSNQINDRLSKMSFNPLTVANADELQAKYPNGNENLIVTADDWHGHVYYNGGWKDTGPYMSVGLSDDEQQTMRTALRGQAFIYDPKQVVAPYNDLNTLPINSIVTYSYGNGDLVANVPKKYNNYTVITFGSRERDKATGAFQIAVSTSGESYHRMYWQDWSDWSKFTSYGSQNVNIYDTNQLVPPYDDLNTIPANNNVTYSLSTETIKNCPTNEGFSLMNFTGASSVDTAGQLLVTVTGNSYIRFGNKDWIQLQKKLPDNINIYDTKQLVPPYDDLNTLPNNVEAIYSIDITGIKNLPKGLKNYFVIETKAPYSDTRYGRTQELTDLVSGVKYQRMLNGDTVSDWQKIVTSNQITNFDAAAPSLAMFGKFAVVGDSYASGSLAKNDGSTFAGGQDNLQWPVMMARKWGTQMLHLAEAGLSTRTWLTSDNGLKKLNDSDPQDIYYLCLGINDYYGLKKDYLGTEADMDSNADTFYGNYARIIKAIQVKSPKALMIMFGVANNEGDAALFADAQKKIADKFGIPFISEREDPFFTSDAYNGQMSGGHPQAPGYGAMALAMERLVQKAIVTNPDYFNRYGW